MLVASPSNVVARRWRASSTTPQSAGLEGRRTTLDRTPRGVDGDIETDICVIGAGPAGITFAREWIGASLRVDIVESGGYDDDTRAQDLSAGPVESNLHVPEALQHGRHRQFGGTTNLWFYRNRPDDGRRYARSIPPEPIDLEARGTRPMAGWGLSLEELRPFYERAQPVWNSGTFEYAIEAWSGPTAQPVGDPGGALATRIVQHGPSDVFRLRYREDLLAADNVTVHPGCTVVELTADDAGTTVRGARIVRPDGTASTIRAKVFVLAAGGVENAQVLLLSASTAPGAVGNRHDNVGRYLTDHPEFRMGMFHPTNPDVFERLGLYDIRTVDGTLVAASFVLSEAVKRAEDLLNLSLSLTPQERGFGTRAHRSLTAIRNHARLHGLAKVPGEVAGIVTAPRDAVAVLRSSRDAYHDYLGGWSRPDVDRSRFRSIEVHAATEQSVERENRIELSDRHDATGRRRARLKWNWSKADRENIGRSMRMVVGELETAGLGRYEPWVDFDGPTRPVEGGIHHPMGSTRMDADPRRGVVDMDGLVHGLSNLYVAGSSVFPTGHGYANPTLTILALTLRLADHVKARLG